MILVMFGIKYIKVAPTNYLFKYVGGKLKKEGIGLSCFYYAPSTTLVSVPIGTTDQSFIFEEVSKDYQEITIQGQITYQINDPNKISLLLDYSLDKEGQNFESDDPEKLPQRIINIIKVLTHTELKSFELRDVVFASEKIREIVYEKLKESQELASMGVSILGLSILAIKPNPETSRALESETKEQILKQADEAVYMRRNAAVEQERAIKENELNTEIAVEQKKRQIRETQMEAEKSVQKKAHEVERAKMDSQINLEEQNKQLVALSAENMKSEADAKAYSMGALLKTVSDLDPKVLQAIANAGMSPEQVISQAFQGLADNASKIGNLNISPELLSEILKSGK